MFYEYLCISSQVLKLGNWKIDIRLHAQIYICIHFCICKYAAHFFHWELNWGKSNASE